MHRVAVAHFDYYFKTSAYRSRKQPLCSAGMCPNPKPYCEVYRHFHLIQFPDSLPTSADDVDLRTLRKVQSQFLGLQASDWNQVHRMGQLSGLCSDSYSPVWCDFIAMETDQRLSMELSVSSHGQLSFYRSPTSSSTSSTHLKHCSAPGR